MLVLPDRFDCVGLATGKKFAQTLDPNLLSGYRGLNVGFIGAGEFLTCIFQIRVSNFRLAESP